VSGNQPILPDLDLTGYQAYEGGVSRLHATLKIEKVGITVTDLGSANGTRLNGKKIPPHTPQPLENGDILALGKFKVQVLIH
jgi:pSer/pThr/pTyr-binding forkhead associated (FHA) protein